MDGAQDTTTQTVVGKADDDELRAQVREVLTATKLSVRKAAGDLKLSHRVLERWLEGEVSLQDRKVAQRAEAWLSKRGTRGVHRDQFVETPTAMKIMGALAHAQDLPDMVSIFGGPGLGKTVAVTQFARDQRERVWVATMTPASSALVSSLEQVCEALGIGEATGGARRLSAAIRKKVMRTRGLIIIDEAQHLSMAAIEELRAIHDATRIGLAFVGNETSFTRLVGGAKSSNYANHAQISSRLGMKVRLKPPHENDVIGVARGLGVTGKDALEFLKVLAAKPGGLRNCVKAVRLLLLRGEKITAESLRKACLLLGAEV